MLFILLVVAFGIIGSLNLVLYYFNGSNDSPFCTKYVLMNFYMSLSDIVDNVIPIAYLLWTHHKSYRIIAEKHSSDPNGLDITFYDDLTS